MCKRPTIWILFALLSISGIVFSIFHYPSVFPIVNLEIKMDRNSALEAARDIAQKYNLGPKDYKQAARFIVDDDVQYYAELEVGESEAFQKLIKEDLYSPYTWEVRHFREGEVNESEIRFTPSGQPYGFSEWLSEDQPGASLSKEHALKIAETEVKDSWKIDLSKYELIDESQKVRPNGRIDHTFDYERPNIKIGDGKYRLSIEVSGDKLTEIYHYIKIPEGFFLRYKEMRSANETIAEVASYVMYLVYILVGCCFGILYLLRRRWVIWKAPLYWGIFVASLQALAAVNEWPGDWMYYDTAISTQVYILEKVVDLTKSFLYDVFLISISFMAAESLTRKAFPNHIQFWRLSSSGVANSAQVVGRTLGGYLLVGFDLAFLVGIYFFSTRVLGWWTPSGVLFEPDILATYAPWFSPIANSIKAGFWEESLCRAVPIAGAALIGQKFGNRRLWIAGAVLFQAILFGALHTNYAGQPSYARLVELIIPSIVYGLIYLRFGLLPCIIFHFVFDAVLMSLPIFVSVADSNLIDKVLVIVLVIAPMGLIFFRRLQSDEWCILKSHKAYNSDWQPAAMRKETSSDKEGISKPKIISSKTFKWILCGGIAGLVVWFFTSDFQMTSEALLIERNQAEEYAKKRLDDRGLHLDESWQVQSSVKMTGKKVEKFILEELGEDIYDHLMGRFLYPPLWKVRFAKFEGDVTERAEEYTVIVYREGEIVGIRHKLPENRPGANLNSDEARKIAYQFLAPRHRYRPFSDRFKEVAAISEELPARRDWTFIFSDLDLFLITNFIVPKDKGEGRIKIKIAGDEIVGAYRYYHIPEDWERKYENEDVLVNSIEEFGYNILLCLVLILCVSAVIKWGRKKYSIKAFLNGFAIFFVINLLCITNNWPEIWAGFSPIEPLSNQILLEISSSIFKLIFRPFIFALLFGLTYSEKKSQLNISGVKACLIAVSLGSLIVGLDSLVNYLIPTVESRWISYDAADSYFPILQASLKPLESYILQTIILIILYSIIDRLTKGWTVKRKSIFCLVIIFWLAFTADSDQNISVWLLNGVLSGGVLLIFYLLVFRYHLSIIPLTSAIISIFSLVQVGVDQAYPGAEIGAVTAGIIIGLASFYWFRKLSPKDFVCNIQVETSAKSLLPVS